MSTAVDVAKFLGGGTKIDDWQRRKAQNSWKIAGLDDLGWKLLIIVWGALFAIFTLLVFFWQPPPETKMVTTLLFMAAASVTFAGISFFIRHRRRPYDYIAADLRRTGAQRVAVVVAEFYEAPNRPFVVVRKANGQLTFHQGTLADLQKEPLLGEISAGSRPASVKTVKCRGDLQDHRLLTELLTAAAVALQIDFRPGVEFPQVQQAVQAFLASPA